MSMMASLPRSGRRQASGEAGFTIVELMIASSVFAVVMVIALSAFIQIGRMYYRGLSASRTQEATRTVTEDISREIQFGSSSIRFNGLNTLCVGTKRYTYVLHKRLVDGIPANTREANQVLRKDSPGSDAASCPVATPAELSAATELLGSGMRLSSFNLTDGGAGKMWHVDVKVAFGEDDLLVGFATLGGDPQGDSTGVQCDGSTFLGGQFCAVSQIKTTVYRRL